MYTYYSDWWINNKINLIIDVTIFKTHAEGLSPDILFEQAVVCF